MQAEHAETSGLHASERIRINGAHRAQVEFEYAKLERGEEICA